MEVKLICATPINIALEVGLICTDSEDKIDNYNAEEIKKVLDLHEKWLNGDGGKRANLSNADLIYANLIKADLGLANLYEANLREADLRNANLYRADLRGANLRGADLSYANLNNADLRGADLHEADLHGADLRGASLSNANLRGANLHEVDLREADLRGANLSNAVLREADLRGANLDFSCFPLWCGGSDFKCDTKLIYQLLAHICTLDFEDAEGIKKLIRPFAAKSHRAEDLGLRRKWNERA